MKSTIKKLIIFAATIGALSVVLAMIGVLSRNVNDTRQDRETQVDNGQPDYQEPIEDEPTEDFEVQPGDDQTPPASSSSSPEEDIPEVPEQDDNEDSDETVTP